MAIQEFQKILDSNPSREQQIHSLKGIASLYFNMKKFDQAAEYHRKVIEPDPNDPETYYSIAVIDWTQAYQEDQKARAGIGLRPDAAVEGQEGLRCTCARRTRRRSKMASPTCRRRSSCALITTTQWRTSTCSTASALSTSATIQPAQEADIKTANEWVDKTIATKKAKAEKAGPSGVITTETPTQSSNG